KMNITFSKSREEMDVEYIHAYLTQSYWNEGITLEKVQKCVDNSLNFGLFDDGKQIGYARVLTDFVRFSYLMDVFIEPKLQGKGYGKLLIQHVFEDEDIKELPGMLLATKDAHTLYEKFGFKRFSEENKNRFMIFKRNETE
ncbi:MAG: GNAT family N-acetyltransferase, partial [Chryseobacterium sp.]|nr:GNAT family N-acetyltransferase [Chryseobacterium sp.]